MDGAATMPLDAFRATLLATLPGVEPLLSAFPWPPRHNLLLFVHRVEALNPGLYLLERDAASAAGLRAAIDSFDWARAEVPGLPLWRLKSGVCEREATLLSCRQPIAGKGCFAIAMIAEFDRTLGEDGAFGYRRLHWEAGAIGQSLYLWATAHGFSGTGIGCFFDDEVHTLLGLEAESTRFQDLYHFTIGAAVDDPRLLTLPAYADERRGL